MVGSARTQLGQKPGHGKNAVTEELDHGANW
jgi:hypothetical protein